jgi:hypothetical protein
MKRPRAVASTLLAASGIAAGCAAHTETFENESSLVGRTDVSAGGGTVGGTVGGTTATPLLSQDKLLGTKPPVVIGWAPDPTFPQKNLRIVERTVKPRVRATATTPAVPGSATFKLGWESTGSPTQVFVIRQSWTLGATNTKEFTQGPPVTVASLGAVPNGVQFWTDLAPPLNTRVCYYVKAGDGTYFSYSNMECRYSPDPDHPHPIGKIELHLRLSTAGTAVTTSNVRARLDWGAAGYTWLDATDTPFFTPGGEATFMLRNDFIKDLSDITMIRVEVPGDDGLCLNMVELIADDTVAFRKTSSTQGCGNGNPFEWAYHSGYIDGTAVEIPFEELRNSSTWKGFSPFVFPASITADNPDGASFVGFTRDGMRRKVDGLAAHKLKENMTDLGSTERRLRNGTSDVTSINRIDEHTVRVQQHMRLDGGTCTVDAHPVFDLTIHSLGANQQPFDGNGVIESTEITTTLLAENIDQGGPCQWLPGIGEYIEFEAWSQFADEFSSIGATSAGKPPTSARFCFPGPGTVPLFQGFDNGGLSLCFGQL